MNDASMVPALDEATLAALAQARHPDPFSVLGPHAASGGQVLRAFLPGAHAVDVLARQGEMHLGRLEPAGAAGLFQGWIASSEPYLLRIEWPGAVEITEDPYAFGTLLGEVDLHLLGEGRHYELASCLGALPMEVEAVKGVRFAVWAPN
ncbi:MAG: 1,4-alpha-glucan branching enzyme, partial [Hyphomicrobiales bacterium]|nr:1,4-alpha-glucan branching enzyme [Hyphomicrobiales bacterium]